MRQKITALNGIGAGLWDRKAGEANQIDNPTINDDGSFNLELVHQQGACISMERHGSRRGPPATSAPSQPRARRETKAHIQ